LCCFRVAAFNRREKLWTHLNCETKKGLSFSPTKLLHFDNFLHAVHSVSEDICILVLLELMSFFVIFSWYDNDATDAYHENHAYEFFWVTINTFPMEEHISPVHNSVKISDISCTCYDNCYLQHVRMETRMILVTHEHSTKNANSTIVLHLQGSQLVPLNLWN